MLESILETAPWKTRAGRDTRFGSLTAEEKKRANQKMCRELGITDLKLTGQVGDRESVVRYVQEVMTPVFRSLVNRPRDITVHTTFSSRLASVEIGCGGDDARFLIGKEGRTADSLRTIFGGVIRRFGFQLVLTVLE